MKNKTKAEPEVKTEIAVETIPQENMRNITFTPIEEKRSHYAKQKSHSLIDDFVGWLFIPIAAGLSLGVALIQNLMGLVNLLCGLGFMGWSLYLSVENYYLLFNKGFMATAIARSFTLWTITSVLMAVVLALWVENLQSTGWKELKKARKQAGTTGRAGIDGGAIASFVIATGLEVVLLLFGFATRGGLTIWNGILVLIALFGYKLGSGMVLKFGGAK